VPSHEIRGKLVGAHILRRAEQFNSERIAVCSIIKHVKRTLAREYSRGLSGKLRAGQMHPIQSAGAGWAGGYCLRRMLVNCAGAQRKTGCPASTSQFRRTAGPSYSGLSRKRIWR
jgi:hypothetical protein